MIEFFIYPYYTHVPLHFVLHNNTQGKILPT